MNDNDQPIEASLADVAAQWIVAMRGEDADRLRIEFENWCRQAPANRVAYDRMASLFDTTAILKTAPQSERMSVRPKRNWLWIGAAMAASIALVVVLSLHAWAAPDGLADRQLAAAETPLTTSHGEIRNFRLPDGSHVTLDADSSAAFNMTPSHRALRLDQGRARVVVAQDARPFAIEAGKGAVVASEAAVDIGFLQGSMIEVRLLAGEASLQNAALRPATYFRIDGEPLAIGRPFAYAREDVGRRVAEAQASATSDWPTGWAEYRSIALGALIEQANRYADQPIVIDDPAIATMQVSGRFRLTDTDGFVERICDLFGLTAIRRSDGFHLRRR